MKIVVIEAGHGIPTHGKRSPDPAKHGGPEQMFEPVFSREIAARLVAMLRENNPDLEVINLCPGPINTSIPIRKPWPKDLKRTRRGYIDSMCLKKNRVIHLSIHANAAPGKGWQSPEGSVQFYREDAGNWSELFANCISKRMAETKIGCRYKKPKSAKMAVLKPIDKRRGRLASAMIECGFMTSKRDVKIMNSETGKAQIVDALHDAICYFLLELGI